MENESKNDTEILTESKEYQNDDTATIPQKNEEITIQVKYNKQIKELDLETAALFAQKGMKYDAIKDNYDELLNLAIRSGKSVPQYLNDLKSSTFTERVNYLTDKCGGDSSLAEHIAKMEFDGREYNNGFNELKAMFPKFKTIDDVPFEILENAKTKGTLLLDEYLRYRLNNERDSKEAKANLEKSEKLSLGSLINRKGAESPETEEFLRGLWK